MAVSQTSHFFFRPKPPTTRVVNLMSSDCNSTTPSGTAAPSQIKSMSHLWICMLAVDSLSLSVSPTYIHGGFSIHRDDFLTPRSLIPQAYLHKWSCLTSYISHLGHSPISFLSFLHFSASLHSTTLRNNLLHSLSSHSHSYSLEPTSLLSTVQASWPCWGITDLGWVNLARIGSSIKQ